MTVHILKTNPVMFRAARDGTKLFEVRQDDRAFQAGDTVVLRYWREPDPFGALIPNDVGEVDQIESVTDWTDGPARPPAPPMPTFERFTVYEPALSNMRKNGWIGEKRSVTDLIFKIGFVLRGDQFGIEPGYVAFSLLPMEKPE